MDDAVTAGIRQAGEEAAAKDELKDPKNKVGVAREPVPPVSDEFSDAEDEIEDHDGA